MEEMLVFQHDPFEDLGFFGEVLDKQGQTIECCGCFTVRCRRRSGSMSGR